MANLSKEKHSQIVKYQPRISQDGQQLKTTARASIVAVADTTRRHETHHTKSNYELTLPAAIHWSQQQRHHWPTVI